MTAAAHLIRPERFDDVTAIRRVHEAAFPADAEAKLVDRLRTAGRLAVSLVAIVDAEVVGHIAFSPVTLAGVPIGLGLAPLAVLPTVAGRGIGAALVRAGLAACRQQGTGLVVVLGDPTYYARFGFTPASQFALRDEYGGGDAFQAIELTPGAVPAGGGLVRYGEEFAVFGV